MINILIATDFSKEAYCALYYATRLFEHQDSKFYIVNFYGEEIHTSIYSLLNEEESIKIPELRQNSQLASQETIHHIIRDSGLKRERFETISSEMKLTQGLDEIIMNKEIDLVVMGTKEHSGTLNSIVGTHTTKTIDKSLPVPLLIVPRELDFTPPVHIGFASELIYDLNFDSLKLVKDIAENFGSQVTVIHDGEETEVSQRQWKNFNSFKAYFAEVPVDLEFASSHLEVSKTVADFVKNNNIDLLSMGYYKHSIPGSLFREPIVEKIDRHLSFPFLVLPEKA